MVVYVYHGFGVALITFIVSFTIKAAVKLTMIPQFDHSSRTMIEPWFVGSTMIFRDSESIILPIF